MRNIGDRIIDLAFIERAAAPIGKTRAFIQTVAEQGFDQVRVSDLLAMPERHRSDLSVEQRMRHLAGDVVNDLDVLPTGMENLEDVLILNEQSQQGLEDDALG